MQTQQLNIQETDRYLRGLNAIETIQWADQEFGLKLYLPTSVGVESAVMFKLVELAGVEPPAFALNSGYWFPETHQHKAVLEERFDKEIAEYGPNEEETEIATKLVAENRFGIDENYTEYNRVTKLGPMSRTIQDLGVTALLSGVRSYQTENRQSLGKIRFGRDGEYRIHPIIDWTEDQTNDFIRQHNLPRNPLYWKGYGSIGDWPLTKPGQGRAGRDNKECGLHTAR